MALLFMDGFDAGDYAIKWSTFVNPASLSSSTRFSTGQCVSITNTATLTKSVTPSAQITVGCAYLPVINISGIQIKSDSAATTHLTLMYDGVSGFLQLRRGTHTGTVLATGTTQIPLNSWSYIELQATIADAGGTARVRVNGSSTDEINFTGDTKNAGTNTTIDAVSLFTAVSGTGRFDDVYILNSTGTNNTTFLGDVRVQTLAPNGNGTYSQMVGSDGNSTDNYQLVDEMPYSTSDYVSSDVVGSRDTYTMGNLLAGTTAVHGMQNNIIAAKSDAGAASARSALMLGGSLYYGATRVLSASYVSYTDIYNTNPNTSSAWTITNVNDAESGVEVA